MVKVNWTIQALDDMDAIAEYISHNSFRYASAFVEKTFQKVVILEKFPQSGRIVPEYNEKNIRELILENKYRIIYRFIDGERVDILMVHHSSSPLPRDSKI